MRRFAAYLGRSPESATTEDLRNFQLHLVDQGSSPVTLNAIITGLKFFCDITLDRPDLMAKMQPVRVPRTLPVVLSREEVARLIAAAAHLKHQPALSLAYGTGLRVSEVVALKVGDIDSQRMTLRVEQGKGSKDRYAMLSPILLERLRVWWRVARAQGKMLNPVTEQAELAQAITEFASRAAEKLRRHKKQASQILTFVRTSPFRRQDDQYSRSMVWPLVRPTQDTAVLVNAALKTLKAIYRPGFNYAKAGVMLMDLMPEGFVQAELDWGEASFPIAQATKDRRKVMGAIDSLNTRYGRGTVKLASGGTEHVRLIQTGTPPPGWKMKQERRTPRYTTHWQELAVVKG